MEHKTQYQIIRNEMDKFIDKTYNIARYFKPNSDKFLQVRVPNLRIIAKQFRDTNLQTIKDLLQGNFNEERALGLIILIDQYKKNPHQVLEFYLANLDYVNNWNLVDCSARPILGEHIRKHGGYEILHELVDTQELWRARVALVATTAFIRKGDFFHAHALMEAIKQYEDLCQEDLIKKAVKWLKREISDYQCNKTRWK